MSFGFVFSSDLEIAYTLRLCHLKLAIKKSKMPFFPVLGTLCPPLYKKKCNIMMEGTARLSQHLLIFEPPWYSRILRYANLIKFHSFWYIYVSRIRAKNIFDLNVLVNINWDTGDLPLFLYQAVCLSQGMLITELVVYTNEPGVVFRWAGAYNRARVCF